MADTGYQCRDCGASAAVATEGERTLIVRTCSCDCPIVAVMDAGLDGSSSLSA